MNQNQNMTIEDRPWRDWVMWGSHPYTAHAEAWWAKYGGWSEWFHFGDELR